MPFLCVTLTFSLQALIISGLLAFTPKYIETQFGLTSSLGSLISRAVTLPFAGVGIMLGMLQYMSALWYLFLHVDALLVYFKRPTTKRLSLYHFTLNEVATVFLAGFLLRCPTHDIAGITVSYPNR